MRLGLLIALTVTLCVSSARALDTPEQAVTKAVLGHQKGETDINGDGLNVMPPTVTKAGDNKTHVVGEIRHTWRGKEPTPIRYDATIDANGNIVGTVKVIKADNPDGGVIGETKSGKLAGTAGNVDCDILMNFRAMRGAVHLIGLVLQEVRKHPEASTRP